MSNNTEAAVLRTCEEMLADRGYAQLQTTRDSPVTAICGLSADGACHLTAYDVAVDKFGIQMARSYVSGIPSAVEGVPVRDAVLVVYGTVTPSAKSHLRSCAVQVFDGNSLSINITKHSLVPRHELMSAEDVAVLLKSWRIRKDQLACLQASDPVSLYYRFRAGDVVKISRRGNGYQQPSVFYRRVVE